MIKSFSAYVIDKNVFVFRKAMECPMACPCKQKMGETDSAKCCYNTCPSKNPVSNKLECENLYCGHDGKTYKGVCALSQCGKTVSF